MAGYIDNLGIELLTLAIAGVLILVASIDVFNCYRKRGDCPNNTLCRLGRQKGINIRWVDNSAWLKMSFSGAFRSPCRTERR